MTKQMQALLDFLKARESSGEIPPSFEEMAAAVGIKSKSGVHRLIDALEERRLVRRPFRRLARAIEVIHETTSEYDRGFCDGYASAMREQRTAA